MKLERIRCTVAGNGGCYYVDPLTNMVYNSPSGGTSWKYTCRMEGGAYLYGSGGSTVLLPVLGGTTNTASCSLIKKAPIGLRPDYVAVLEYDKARAREIAEAIERYAAELHPIPPEWINELNELIERNQPTEVTE